MDQIKSQSNNESNQLRLLILLLAVVVVLPSVCLLWFLVQATGNERLLVQQKLHDFYQSELERKSVIFDEYYNDKLTILDQLSNSDNYLPAMYEHLAGDNIAGMVIYNDAGKRLWPTSLAASQMPEDIDILFADAVHTEYIAKDYQRAALEYGLFADDYDEEIMYLAKLNMARCWYKAGDIDQALAICKELTLSDYQTLSQASLVTISNAAMFMLDIVIENDIDDKMVAKVFANFIDIASGYPLGGSYLPLEQCQFIIDSAIRMIASKKDFADDIPVQKLKLISDILNRGQGYVDSLGDHIPEHWPDNAIVALAADNREYYAISQKGETHSMAILIEQRDIDNLFAAFAEDVNLDDTSICFTNSDGLAIYGNLPDSDAFMTMQVASCLPDYQLQLYLTDTDVFARTAQRRISAYIWMVTLVIIMVIAGSVLAGRIFRRQIKLNRLKNDFVATVTHELKTPLASMRALVDTILEGRYKDPAKVNEYLQLIGKENSRLSRLIDNFLSFSRMDRNKQQFNICKVAPDAIAIRAAEAIKTKYAQFDCQLEIKIDDNLPQINSDSDAMVMALMNLLDNACKYGKDIDRKVILKVYGNATGICFAVEDNGIGIPRRLQRRIFERFYQADQRLARKAEGCGLGLSIVKFICDAHQGDIAVKSNAGTGSTFTITLPTSI